MTYGGVKSVMSFLFEDGGVLNDRKIPPSADDLQKCRAHAFNSVLTINSRVYSGLKAV